MKGVKLAAIALTITLLSGCFGPKQEEEVYTVFENAAKQEASLYQEAAELEKLEVKNQELYSKILKDGKQNNEAVQATIEEALQEVSERESILQKEETLLQAAQEKMTDAKLYIDKIENSELNKRAQKTEELYRERFEVFKEMHKVYKTALQSEKELYTMLKEKTQKLKEVNDKVVAVNKNYVKVSEWNTKFNDVTAKYNNEKLSFYKQAGFKVKKKTS
ncbi:YkyA family protein [Bacillus sp. 165]|uniref:YkyA family protein n=1 Tax=Bacillus sp. 165 TaxID=1529117 RepID=UPI001ADB2CFC|nr:YkyA family protein [Bacillus sp. 165]MBO9130366.1 YkyA family protein [Bacillus sp. 165]